MADRRVIVGTVVGGAEVSRRFRTVVPALVRANVATALNGLATEMLRKVKVEQLSKPKGAAPGPQGALSVQTGTLRRSINRSPATGVDEKVQGHLSVSVGTNVFYGRIWELHGLPGRASASGVTRSWPPRPFLRPALDQMRSAIDARVRAAIEAGAKGSTL